MLHCIRSTAQLQIHETDFGFESVTGPILAFLCISGLILPVSLLIGKQVGLGLSPDRSA